MGYDVSFHPISPEEMQKWYFTPLTWVQQGQEEKVIIHHLICSGTRDGDVMEALKRKEKDGNKTILSGVPKGMPALPKACRIQQKVSTAGFDWPERSEVWDKVAEETAEVQAEIDRKDTDRLEAEFGDLLFSVVNAARLYGVNPDLALERTNRKFIRRFGYMEQQTIKQGVPLQSLTPEQLETLWQEAKTHDD